MRIATPILVPPGSAVDTRPLEPARRGSLALGAPDRTGRLHVSAASGIAVAGGATWVVSDEYGELVRFGRLDGPGRLHPGLAPAKKKPDLESLLAVPQAGGGALLVAFGSGSKADGTRSAALVQAVDGAGALRGGPVRVDLAPLYAALSARLANGINVEGLALRCHELLVLHRGQRATESNVVFRLDAARAVDALRRGAPLGADLLLGSTTVDLGSLGGVKLGFADAFTLPDGRIAFIASAEATADDAGDGSVVGSAVGILDHDLRVQVLRPLTGSARKAEGIVPTRLLDPAASATSFTLVTDPDDPARAAEVLTVDLG